MKVLFGSIALLPLTLSWDSPMMTVWGKTGVPEIPAYPRPMLVRGDDTWHSLNRKWQIDTHATSFEEPPFGTELDDTILVPYPIESTLGGVRRLTDEGYAWYRLVLPVTDFAPECAGRTLLHFEASDYNTTVFLNSNPLGFHAGGYDPFLFDVTSALASNAGDVELVVGTFDPTAAQQARGKQRNDAFNNPRGITYTSTSGIWGTVWTECVPAAAYIDDVATITDPVKGIVEVEIELAPGGSVPQGLRIEVGVTSSPEDDTEIASASASFDSAHGKLAISLPSPLRLWDPTSPNLYGLTIKLVGGGDNTLIDIARSYFGVRSLTLGRSADGHALPLFNGHPLFMMGTLDQGFWPESQYTAPTDEALRSDIVAHKDLGFNMVRKHVKMEPRRWYHHCDKLGLLVWQDVPSKDDKAGMGSPVYEQWLLEMQRDVKARRSHPSIVMWVTYNENWGQTDAAVEDTIASLKEVDSSRLVNDASGGGGIARWVGGLHGNFTDVHHYSRPEFDGDAARDISEADPERALVLGEYGGIMLVPEGHEWAEGKCHGYATVKNGTELDNLYASYNVGLGNMVADWKAYPGLSAAVYTEITDVETECNGLLTYDRLFKVSKEAIFKSNQELIANATAILEDHVTLDKLV